VVGTTWQVIANVLTGDKEPVKAILPKEGSTGWSDTWMISSKAKNPNCMYMWMDHIASPKANAAATEYFGEAPSNKKACALTKDKKHCDTFHATDEAYFDQVAYWTTPVKDCGDDRGEVCKDYSEWVKAWTEIKG
jgi:putative spermidine/putrescine transport system substrate-binding protein